MFKTNCPVQSRWNILQICFSNFFFSGTKHQVYKQKREFTLEELVACSWLSSSGQNESLVLMRWVWTPWGGRVYTIYSLTCVYCPVLWFVGGINWLICYIMFIAYEELTCHCTLTLYWAVSVLMYCLMFSYCSHTFLNGQPSADTEEAWRLWSWTTADQAVRRSAVGHTPGLHRPTVHIVCIWKAILIQEEIVVPVVVVVGYSNTYIFKRFFFFCNMIESLKWRGVRLHIGAEEGECDSGAQLFKTIITFPPN